MIEGEVRRRVLTPFWSAVHPMQWTTNEGIGIAQFALEGKVGLFNISWWLLGRVRPPEDANVYRKTPILWAIMVCSVVQPLTGRTLADCAAMMTRAEWETLLRRRRVSLGSQLYRQGMTPANLDRLLNRKEFA